MRRSMRCLLRRDGCEAAAHRHRPDAQHINLCAWRRLGLGRRDPVGAPLALLSAGLDRCALVSGRGSAVFLAGHALLRLVPRRGRAQAVAGVLPAGSANVKETARPARVRKHPSRPPFADGACVKPRRRTVHTAGRRLHAIGIILETIRCGKCNRKLAEAEYRRIAIKCPRCGTLNIQRAASPFNPERHRASNRKESTDGNTQQDQAP